eukprot:TRINITY_DN2122_c0_g1_i1.p1 TRINITY_DN2122_c0_g1~~TRINITY_DN2122_c0_g1_i1.p1  ORF type:complete len:623 (+),score=155.55 TRINITY_DN2122_c0_g1_i1:2-1870(+)
MSAAQIIASFFSPERLVAILELVMMHCMVLNQDDIWLWENDYETLMEHEQLQVSTHNTVDLSRSFNLHLYGEHLLLSCLSRDREFFAQKIIELLQSIQQAVEAKADLANDKLRLDVMYQCVGLGSYDLHDFLNFNDWLGSSIGPLLASASESDDLPTRVLLRRALWLCSCWAADVGESVQTQLLELCVGLICYPDPMVATTALKTVVTLCKYSASALVPVLPQAMENVITLFSRIEGSGARVNTLKQLVEMMDMVGDSSAEAVASNADQFMTSLAQIWESCPDESLVKGQVLYLMNTTLHGATTKDSTCPAGYQEAISPLIRNSLRMEVAEFEYLRDPAIQLWLSLVRASDTYTEVLHNLLEVSAPLLDNSLEPAGAILDLIRSYWLLGKENCFQHQELISYLLSKIIGEVGPKVIPSLVKCLETMLILFPVKCFDLLKPHLKKLVIALHGKDIKMSHKDVIVGDLVPLCRVIAQTPEKVGELLNEISTDLWPELLQLIIKSYPHITTSLVGPSRRRLFAHAAMMCLKCGDQRVLGNLRGVLKIAYKVISNLSKAPLTFKGSSLDPERHRHEVELQADQVMSMNFQAFCNTTLTESCGMYGVDLFNQAFSQASPAVKALFSP